MKNFSQAWVTGSVNHRTSTLLDHMEVISIEKLRMCLRRSTKAKASNEPIISNAVIALSLLMLDEVERERMRRKFGLCYLMAKEGITFKKYLALYELEACRGFGFGPMYKTALSTKLFTHYCGFPASPIPEVPL